MNITVLGAGAWGTALAIAVAKKNPTVLWARNAQTVLLMQQEKVNTHYLPDYTFPDLLTASAHIEQAVNHSLNDKEGLLIIASSVSGLRPILKQIKHLALNHVLWLCKGFEEGTGLLPHQIVEEECAHLIQQGQFAYGALSGPSFAQEVAQGLPCALTVASASQSLCKLAVQGIHSSSLRVYSTQDVIGVEVGGAVKNILAIASGISDGMGLGLNARAALMTRGLSEMSRLCLALGGKQETLSGLTGVGDLILTCTGNLSRNRKVGLALAEGKQLPAIIEELGHVAEGVLCAQTVFKLAQKLGVEMPITQAVSAVLFEHAPVKAVLEKLMARDAKTE